MRLIDAEFEEKHYTSMLLTPTPDVTKLDQKNARIVIDALKMAPTVDAVPVVRCGECKWFQANMMPDGYLPKGVPEYECRHWCGAADPTDYCADGERKGGADDADS